MKTTPRVLAVASGGGHWVQMLRLRPAFADCDLHFASVDQAHATAVAGAPFYRFVDANRDRKGALLVQIAQLLWIILRTRPQLIVSTGASCGYVAIRIGKLLGCRTVFVDSIANAEQLSLSGRLAARHADLMLTQWPHLAADGGARDAGALL